MEGNLPQDVGVACMDKRDGSVSPFHLVNHSGHAGTTWHEPVEIPEHRIEARTRVPRGGERARLRRTAGPFICEPEAVKVARLRQFEAILVSYTE